MKRWRFQSWSLDDRTKLATPAAFNAVDESTKIHSNNDNRNLAVERRPPSVPANSHKDETKGEKRPSTTSADRYDRVDRYLMAKAWRLADPESGETNGREKQRDESDGSEITALPPREVCRIPVNSNHRGWYFQHDTMGRFIYPTNLRNELNTSTRLLIIIG